MILMVGFNSDVIMKTLTKSLMLAAVAATAFISCSKEIENPVENVKASSHVEFSAQIVGEASSTKATLTTTDDKDFAAAWVDGTDLIGLYAYDGNSFDETAPATWNESNETFEAVFQTAAPTVAGAWQYKATYPYDADGNIPFGSPRVQNGNAYNSAYDIMYGAVNYDNALLGKDNTGANFVIPMNRLTGIAYFHITGGPDEDVVSATLEATGIAAENVTIASNGASVAASTGSASLDAITITFADGTAPKATDLKLWFNVLPSSYSGLKLTINTTTKTAVLNSNKTMTYTAGKLNKAVLSSLTWNNSAKTYTKVTSEPTDWSGTYLIVFEGATVNSVDVPPVAFDGSIDDLTAANNGTSVTISGNTITGNSTIDAAVFEISAVTGGYSIQAVSNTNYIGNASDSNNITSSTDALVNTISLNSDNSVNIISSGGAFLRYNASSGQYRFRYYKSSSYTNQKPVYLYLLEGSGVVDTRDDVTLSFSPATPNAITLGDSFTEPTLTVDPVAAASSVTYTVSSEPANCATIGATTGELTISAAGVITVTASIPQNDPDFKPASASYTLTVNSPAGHGTSASDPFSVAEVITFVNGLSTTPTTDEYYVSGIISSIANNGTYGASGTFGNATFFISDDGSTTTQFEAFRVLYLGNVKWTSGNPDIAVGDEVVICGRLTKYNDQVETYAVTGDNAYNGYLYSLDKAPYFTANVTSSSIEYTGGNTITLNISANVNWTASINNGASLKIGDANAAASVSGSADTAVSVIIPENTAGQTYTISFTTTSQDVSAPADIQIIQTKQESLLSMEFAAGTEITADNYGEFTYTRPISVQFAKGSGNLTYYSPVRFYVGNTLTISTPFNNVLIKKVEFTVTQAGAMTANQGTYSNGTWLGETSSLVLTSTTQTRFSDFTVYYSVDGELPALSSITVDNDPTKTTYTVGNAFDFAGATVTAHYSDNTSTMDVTTLVTTDGATVVATEGTGKTVTVSYTEDGVTKTDTFTIDVNASAGGSTTVSMDSFSDVSGYVDGDTNVSYSATKGESATAPAVNSGEIRIYQNGGLLTITANNNKTITNITIGSSMATKVQVNIDNGGYGSDNSITAGGTYSTGTISASTVTFKCTGDSKTTRLYLNSLSVTYE